MLIGIFMGLFGFWMAILSVFHSAKHSREEQPEKISEPLPQRRATASGRPEVAGAFRELWAEITRGA